MKNIADTGLLVGALDRLDPHHDWARAEFERHAPWVTCEAVLSETAFFVPPFLVMQLLDTGDLTLDFSLQEEQDRVLALVGKYQDQPMSIADACLVRMAEKTSAARIWTVDRRDFTLYRRQDRRPLLCHFPPLTP